MTSQELDEAIKQAIIFETKHISPYAPHMTRVVVDIDGLIETLKPVIKDCIEAVTPKRKADFSLLSQNLPSSEYNKAIDTIKNNTKELLG